METTWQPPKAIATETLATEATPNQSLSAMAMRGKPVAEIAMGETAVRLARCKATDAEEHSPATVADATSLAGQPRTERDSKSSRPLIQAHREPIEPLRLQHW